MLREKIDESLKASMKAQDEKLRVATLRLVMAAIKDRDIAARSADQCDGVSDDEILGILTKMVKQREDSAEQYEKGARPELAEAERAEIEVIKEFLPRQMTQEEIETVVTEVVAEFEADGLKDMGKCMGALKERYHGSMDFGSAGKLMKAALS